MADLTYSPLSDQSWQKHFLDILLFLITLTNLLEGNNQLIQLIIYRKTVQILDVTPFSNGLLNLKRLPSSCFSAGRVSAWAGTVRTQFFPLPHVCTQGKPCPFPRHRKQNI